MDKVIKNFQNISYGPAPEDSKEVNSWIKNLKNPNNHFINGKFVKSSSSKKLNIINPSTNKKIATLSVASKKDVNAAVSAAKKAHVKWSKLSSFDRSKYLYALARLIQKNSRFISVLETIDNGKPIRETRDIDIPLVARHFYYHAGWAARNTNNSDNSIGVVGQIIPWNFPLLMLAWKIAPAIALGNTVVLKPAEYTSLTALYFAELCEKAKIPQGVINIITGDGSTGEHITSHKDIKKIAFTGSTEVGKKIIQTNTNPDKKMTMELGGKSPFIVFEDADLDSAVEGVVDAIWFNQGQVCCAGSRLLVQESIEKKFIQKLKKRMEKLRVGDPLDKSIDIGAIVAPVQLKKINSLVNKAQKDGNKLWQPSWSCPTNGLFYPPSLFTPLDFGLVGFSFACGLGVKVAKPNKKVISLMGDGGFGMTISELSTAVEYNINTITIVMNNKSWGAEKAYQKDFYGKRYLGADISSPPFDKVAELYGARGFNVKKVSEINQAVSEALKINKPVVIDVDVDPKALYSFRRDSFRHRSKK